MSGAPATSPVVQVPRPRRGPSLAPRTQVALIAAGAAALRAPFLTRPAGSDEGGLLLIASQWHPGSSLYGDYWGDRPPLLLEVLVVADHLGGLVALRVIGLVAVVVSVVVAGPLGRFSGGSRRGRSPPGPRGRSGPADGNGTDSGPGPGTSDHGRRRTGC